MPKRVIVAAAVLAGAAYFTPEMTAAQSVNAEARAIINSMPAAAWPKWFPPALNQALSIPAAPGVPHPQGTKPPAVIPQSEVDPDPSGSLGSYQPGGPTVTANNAFFLPLGTNGRTCFSCHQPASGMSISTSALNTLYRVSLDKDPVFAPVDGANCPNTPHNHSLLLRKGLFRIFLPLPANAEFKVAVMSDPTGCNTNPTYATGADPVTGNTVQIVSVFRRPLVATDLKFVTDLGTPPADPITGQSLCCDLSTGLPESGNIMWDGREQTLSTQAWHATAGHAQATQAQLDKLGLLNSQGQIQVPQSTEMNQIVAFENGIYSAQIYDLLGGSLTANGATGGPVDLAAGAAKVPDTVDKAFTLYNAWSAASGARQQSIYRGMNIFLGGKTFPIANVSGIDNITIAPGVTLQNVLGKGGGSCSTCHSVPNSGSDSFRTAQHDIGIGGSSQAFGGPAPSSDLPIFKLTCNSGVTDTPAGYHGNVVMTNDPGMALISGLCRDIGRFTVPPLRGLASRAPYFSDGSAPALLDVVNFYNNRFNIGLTQQQKQDLVNFLNAL